MSDIATRWVTSVDDPEYHLVPEECQSRLMFYTWQEQNESEIEVVVRHITKIRDCLRGYDFYTEKQIGSILWDAYLNHTDSQEIDRDCPF